jgi:hypothetical protein
VLDDLSQMKYLSISHFQKSIMSQPKKFLKNEKLSAFIEAISTPIKML